MAQFKSKEKSDQLIVRVKLSRGEELFMAELECFSRLELEGFLKPVLVAERFVEYTGPSAFSLKERLDWEINRKQFFSIMAQLIQGVKKLQRAKLLVNNLILDTKSVFIEKKTGKLQFLYLPVSTNRFYIDVIGFIASLVGSMRLDVRENVDYVMRFDSFIRGLEHFDAEAIEDTIRQIEPSVFAGEDLPRMDDSGFMTDKPKDYYDHYSIEPEWKTTLLVADEQCQDDEKEPPETMLLGGEDLEWDETEETGLLGIDGDTEPPAPPIPHYPILIRLMTNERITVDRQVFRIGKQRDCVDYFVDNKTVSRSHANIISRGQSVYVKDLRSKNRTFLNGEAIPEGVETELHDGDILRFSNEEFLFHA